MILKKRDLFLVCLNFCFSPAFADKAHEFSGEKFVVKEVAEIRGIPWGFDFLPDGRIIITLKSGKVLIKDGDKLDEIHVFPEAKKYGQGGLMDVKVHPDFSKNKTLFFSYAKEYASGIGTVISKATLENNKLTSKIIFRSNPPGSGGRHFGSRIVLKDGKLFFGIGDRGERKEAQKKKSHLGKILRINEDGSIPPDNPFKSAIWSMGHRNPQGLYYDGERNILWEQEHGPRGDEINIIKQGKNYGWPTITYGKEYWGPSIGPTHKRGLEQPVKYFTPSIAPSSLMVYSGKLFKNWKGDLFSTALMFDHINKLKLNDKNRVVDEARFEVKGRLRHIEERPTNVGDKKAGEIYFSTDEGFIYKMTKN